MKLAQYAAITSVAVALCPAVHGQATPPPAAPSPSLLNEVVVLAPRIDESADKLGSAYTRISGSEITRDQMYAVKPVVNLSPGVFASGAAAEGGISVLSIRGNRPDHSLILVDGVKANTGVFQNASPFLSSASSLNLESLEIVRGPFSPLFGSDAIAGVVSLQTKRGSGTPSATLFFEGGTFNTFHEGILSDGSLGPLDYSFHYARLDSSNQRPDNDVSNDSASLRLDWQVCDALTLGLIVRTQVADYQDPVAASLFGFVEDSHYKVTGEMTTVALYAEWKPFEPWVQRLTLGYYREVYALRNPEVVNALGPQENYESLATNLSLDWQHTVQITERNKLIGGFTVLNEKGHDGSFEEKEITNVALYLQDQWEVIERLTLTAGGRWDHYEISGDAFTYRLSGAYFLEPTRTKFRASYGTAFKSPSFFQLFSTSIFALGDPHLKPETSEGWDVGIDQYFLGDRLAVSATWFRNDISDLIAWVDTSPITGSYVNRDKAENEGLELSLVAKFTPTWQARFAYTYTESYEITPTGRTRADYRPRNLLSAETSVRLFDRLTLGAGVFYVAQQEALDWNTAQRVDIGDYTVYRVHGRFEVNPNIAITARIENLTDEKYVSRLDFPGLGRAVYAGLEIRF